MEDSQDERTVGTAGDIVRSSTESKGPRRRRCSEKAIIFNDLVSSRGSELGIYQSCLLL